VGRLELAGAPRLLLAGAAAVVAFVTAVPATQAAAASPRPTDLQCVKRCAGRQTVAVGAVIRITGRRLDAVDEVNFRGAKRRVHAKPRIARNGRLTVEVPRGARSGMPRVVDAGGKAQVVHKLLRVVPGRRLPSRGGFDLVDSRVRPQRAFVDGGHPFTLSYRFRAYGSRDVTVKLVRHGHTLRTWKERDRLPYVSHRLRWSDMLSRRRAAPRGHYRFELKAPGHHGRPTPRFRLLDGKFPVRGTHGYGGAEQRFGAPRSGGRVHQGQDVFSPCGMRVVAARGGRVEARGFDPVLYGNWLVIDARGTTTDYRYAHFLHPASVHDGERVHTGDDVGRIGRTGNARTVGCMLHFEVWPHGWENGGPIDPLPILKRWDGWS
jgi:Peptidase family M23